MRSALFPDKKELIFTELERPTVEEGYAIIEVCFAGICGSDVNVWQGMHGTATYPRIPGHEFVGVLREFIGNPNEDLESGDIVVVQPYYSCGKCEQCTSGKSNICKDLAILGIHMDGGFAEFVKVPLDKVVKMPKDVDLQVAALTEPLSVAVHDVRRSNLKVGQSVAVIGGGPIGALIAIVARLAGASNVTICEVNENRVNFLRKLGFDAANPVQEDPETILKAHNGGSGFDVVFEVSGSKGGVQSMTALAKPGGTIMAIGMSATQNPFDGATVFFKELQIIGARLHSQSAFRDAAKIVASGKINQELKQLIDRVFPLSEVVEAMNYQINDKEHFKVLIDISK
ncbi:MAG: alcohol dehydrogenase catalytic domain-containing protein [Christensenella sp.]|nr:alcohol dehydrogenase catalytic domain-containing protein [Christensenella sp.]